LSNRVLNRSFPLPVSDEIPTGLWAIAKGLHTGAIAKSLFGFVLAEYGSLLR
jgi:hypothetical protein